MKTLIISIKDYNFKAITIEDNHKFEIEINANIRNAILYRKCIDYMKPDDFFKQFSNVIICENGNIEVIK